MSKVDENEAFDKSVKSGQSVPEVTEEDRYRDLEDDYRIAGKDGMKEWQAAIRLALHWEEPTATTMSTAHRAGRQRGYSEGVKASAAVANEIGKKIAVHRMSADRISACILELLKRDTPVSADRISACILELLKRDTPEAAR